MGGVLGVCETVDQTRALLQSDWRSKIDIYLATEAQVAYELMQQNIPFKAPEDFYSEAALTKHCDPLAAVQFEWIHWIDEFLQAAVPTFKAEGFQPATSHMFCLKILVDVLFMQDYALRHIVQALNPSHIVFSSGQQNTSINPTLFFETSVYGALIATSEQNLNASLTDLYENAHPNIVAPHKPLSSHLRAFVAKHVRQVQTYGLFPYWHRWWSKRSDQLVIYDTYDVREVAVAASQRHIPWTSWQSMVTEIQELADNISFPNIDQAVIWEEMTSSPQFHKPFRYQGGDFWNMAKARLCYWWESVVVKQWRYFIAARQVLSKNSPKALILPHAFEDVSVSILRAAKMIGIPTAVYQHGGFVGNSEDIAYDFRDLPHVDFLFTYGNATSEYFKNRVAPKHVTFAKPISVGSARLDRVARQRPNKDKILKLLKHQNRPIVVYYSGPNKAHTRYHNCSMLPSVSLLKLQAEIFKCFSQFNDLHFVYKMHPGARASAILAQNVCPSCEVFTNEILLTDLLYVADLIVADEPSTGLLETLLTQAEMLVYAEKEILQLTQSSKKLLPHRVHLTESQEDFLSSLQHILENRTFFSNKRDHLEARKAFATHLDDGNSACRVLDFMMHQ